MIPSVKHLPCETRLQKLKLWSLGDRRIRADLMEVYPRLYIDYHLLTLIPSLNTPHIIEHEAIPPNSTRRDHDLT